MDQCKGVYALGYSSLHNYATKGLGFSDEVAYIYIRVARKSKEVPQLKEEIKNGNLTVSKAVKVVSVLNPKNQDHWLRLAKTSTARKIEKEVATVQPKKSVQDKAKYVSRHRLQLQAGVSEDLMLKLRRAQDLVSQKKRKMADLEETLEELVKLYLKKNDPVQRANRQNVKGKLNFKPEQKGASKEPFTCTPVKKAKSLPSKPKHEIILKREGRKPLPAETKHKVFLKYKGRCAHNDKSGDRCHSKRFLEIHHIRPVSQGGSNELTNLLLVCAGHHKVQHQNIPISNYHSTTANYNLFKSPIS